MSPQMVRKTEFWNTVSHAIGVFFGLILLFFGVAYTLPRKEYTNLAGLSIYAVCFILLFLASTVYHGARNPVRKARLRVFDHSAIFFFIAGTYTPIVLHLLHGPRMWLFLSFIWALAIGGFVFKLLTKGKYDKYKVLSTYLYLAMGWVCLLIFPVIIRQHNPYFLGFLFSGGVLYSIGTIFYRNKTYAWSHVIWHIFVLLAAMSHIASILCLIML